MDAWTYTADFHTHTRHSDGKGSVLDNARFAEKVGLWYVGITDHGERSIGRGVKRLEWAKIRDEVTEAQRKTGIKVLMGCEANVVSRDGEIDVPYQVRKRMDVVLAGLHTLIYPNTLSDGLTLLANNLVGARVSRRLRARARVDNTKAIVSAVHRNRIDIVSHPGLGLNIDTEELAAACSRRGTALEISSAHEHISREYIEIAARQGVMFAFGSDAHRPEDVGNFARAEALAKSAKVEPREVLNVRDTPAATGEKQRFWHRLGLTGWPGEA